MRIALTTTTALALAPSVVDTFRVDHRRERRQWKRELDAAASSQHSHKPLWQQPDRQLAAGVKPCDPSSTRVVSQRGEDEPDVGILAQCSPGYSCRPLPEDSEYGAFGGGICVSNDDDGSIQVQRRQRKLQIDNYCTYYEEAFGYDCNCDNWNDNTGTFDCSYSYGNTTFFGFPVAMMNYLNLTVTEIGAPFNVNIKMCYNALNDAPSNAIQSYCRTEYASYDEYGGLPSDQTCAVTLNDQMCDSCTVAKCNDTETFEYPDSFDCSNIETDVVVEDICGGNTIWRQLYADEFPTSEPTGYPTFVPTMTTMSPDDLVNTPPPANDDATDNGNAAPTVADGPTTPGPAPTALAGDSSGAWSASKWSTVPMLVGGLFGVITALN